MIRFSAALVVAGLGLLLAGALTSELILVYAAIVVCVIATIALATGVIAGRDEILGRELKATGGTGELRRETAAASVPAAATAFAGAPAASWSPAADTAPPQAEPSQASSGLGWPAGKSPAEALWARVDAELSSAGASVEGPKLTKDSATEEVWGRVELELGSPAPWAPPQRTLQQAASATAEHSAPYEPIILNGPDSSLIGGPATVHQPDSGGPDEPDGDDDQWLPARWDDADDAPAATSGTGPGWFPLYSLRNGDEPGGLPAEQDQPEGPAEPAGHGEPEGHGEPAGHGEPEEPGALEEHDEPEDSGEALSEASESEVGSGSESAESEAEAEAERALNGPLAAPRTEYVPGDDLPASDHTSPASDDDTPAAAGSAVASGDDHTVGEDHVDEDHTATDDTATDDTATDDTATDDTATDDDGGDAAGSPDLTGSDEPDEPVTGRAASPSGGKPAEDAPTEKPAEPAAGPAADDASPLPAPVTPRAAPSAPSPLPQRKSDATPLPQRKSDATPLPQRTAGASPLPQRTAGASPLSQPGAGSSLFPPRGTGSSLFPQRKSDPSPLPQRGPGSSLFPPRGTGSSGSPLFPQRKPDPAPLQPPSPESPATPSAPQSTPSRVILVPGVPRYHRTDCILIRFLSSSDVESVTREAAEAAGCVPCRACEPD